MLETANEGVWLVDREARTQYVNDRMAALLGAMPDQIAAGSILDFVFGEDVPAARERIAANLAGQSEEFDFRFRRVDGGEVLVLAGTSQYGTAQVGSSASLVSLPTSPRGDGQKTPCGYWTRPGGHWLPRSITRRPCSEWPGWRSRHSPIGAWSISSVREAFPTGLPSPMPILSKRRWRQG
jgi:PAS domain S-box-containing protein